MQLITFLLALLVASTLAGLITANNDRASAVKPTIIDNNVIYQYNIRFFDTETQTYCPGRYAVSFGIIGNRLDLNVIEDSFEVGETPCDLTKKSLVMNVSNDLGLFAFLLGHSMPIPM